MKGEGGRREATYPLGLICTSISRVRDARFSGSGWRPCGPCACALADTGTGAVCISEADESSADSETDWEEEEDLGGEWERAGTPRPAVASLEIRAEDDEMSSLAPADGLSGMRFLRSSLSLSLPSASLRCFSRSFSSTWLAWTISLGRRSTTTRGEGRRASLLLSLAGDVSASSRCFLLPWDLDLDFDLRRRRLRAPSDSEEDDDSE